MNDKRVWGTLGHRRQYFGKSSSCGQRWSEVENWKDMTVTPNAVFQKCIEIFFSKKMEKGIFYCMTTAVIFATTGFAILFIASGKYIFFSTENCIVLTGPQARYVPKHSPIN